MPPIIPMPRRRTTKLLPDVEPPPQPDHSYRRGEDLPSLVDAHAGRLAAADVIFVFGTQHWTPAELAAALYGKGLAPVIVTTGGAARHPRGLTEALIHRDLIVTAGVPTSDVLVETRSTNTEENVTMALPLLRQLGDVKSVIAIVKWFHRRALITLAAHLPSVERIYAADYEPFNWHTRTALSRATWRESCPRSVAKEVGYLHDLRAKGVDLLRRTDDGWIRNARS